MATQITATSPRTRPVPRLGVLGIAILAIRAVAVIGVGVWSQAGSTRDVTVEDEPGVQRGLPASRRPRRTQPLRPGSTVAGPSGPLSTVDLAGHHGAG